VKKIIRSVQGKIASFSANLRRESVDEVADTIIETLTLSKLDGRGLTATELSGVVLKINSSVVSFLAEKKIKTEETLEDINNALEELKNGL
jgi:hypothetical protein